MTDAELVEYLTEVRYQRTWDGGYPNLGVNLPAGCAVSLPDDACTPRSVIDSARCDGGGEDRSYFGRQLRVKVLTGGPR